MYAYRRRQNKQRRISLNLSLNAIPGVLLGVGAVFLTFGFVLPKNQAVANSGARFFSEGLDIKLDRTSPAFAALEDAWTRPSFDNSGAAFVAAERGVSSIPLVAGAVSAARIAESIAQSNVREDSLIRQEKSARDENSRQLAKAAVEILRQMAARFAPAPVVEPVAQAPAARVPGAQVPRSRVPVPAAYKTASALDPSFVQQPTGDAPLNPQTAVVTKQIKNISLTDLQMSREELFGSLFLPIAKSKSAEPPPAGSPTSGGVYQRGISQPPVVVANGVARRPPQNGSPPAPAFGSAQPLPGALGGESSSILTAALDNHKPMVRGGPAPPPGAPAGAPAAAPAEQTVVHQVFVTGTIELSQGLAVTNAQDHVVLRREVDGEMQESGAVWMRDGRYEIFVEQNTGLLIGELFNSAGEVAGRGVIDLATAPLSGQGQHRIEGVAMQLQPFVQGLGGSVVSERVAAQSRSHLPGLKGAQVAALDLPLNAVSAKGGTFVIPNLAEGSLAIVKVSHPGYWGTLAIARAGDDNQLAAFPNQDGQMIRQLMAIQRTVDIDMVPSAVVWGRVTSHGQPLAGARVELAGADESVKPIYFNSTLKPDPGLSETQANGLYAFFPVSPGTNAIQLVNVEGDAISDPIVFPTEEKSVARVDLESLDATETKVKIFNAFKTDEPLASVVSVAGSSGSAQIDGGMGVINHLPGHHLLLVDSDAGPNFEHVRAVTDRNRHILYVPMIPTVWIDQLKGALKFNAEPGMGTIVGFVQSQSPFKVAMEIGSLGANSRIFYFKSTGQLSKTDYGEPGGGYIIFNVPKGFRTMAVQTSGSEKVHSIVTLVDPKVVNVVNHAVR